MSLGNFLRTLTKQHEKIWDLIIGPTEYAYNDSVYRSTSRIPFKIVYGYHLGGVLELRYVKDMRRGVLW